MTLVWVDLETTGLSFVDHDIIEAAVVITDNYGCPVATREWLVKPVGEDWMDRGDPYAMKMHEKSGLLEEILSAGSDLPSPSEVAHAALAFIKGYITQGESPLCGSTAHFDRGFLHEWMPDFLRHLHYRVIDVSTLNEIVKRVNPELATHIPSPDEKDKPHRALLDIEASIAVYRWHLDNSIYTV